MNIFTYHFSILQFLLIVFIGLSIFLFIELMAKGLLERIKPGAVKLLQKQKPVFYLLLILVILFAFIAVNPVTHLILVLILGVLNFESLRNIFLGGIMRRIISFEKGRIYKIEDHQGILTSLGWVGIRISERNEEVFLTYKYINDHGVKEQSKASPLVKKIKCLLDPEKSGNNSEEKILSVLFDQPYLISVNQVKSIIGKQEIILVVGIFGEEYSNCLIDVLQMNGFEPQMIEN